MNRILLSRRALIAGLGSSLGLAAALPAWAAEGFASPFDFGFDPSIDGDQSAALQAAIDGAAAQGKRLLLPPGEYSVRDLNLHGSLQGMPGQTHLLSSGEAPVGRVSGLSGVRLEGISFGGGPAGDNRGVLELENATGITIRDCSFTGPGVGIAASASSATIDNCMFAEMGDAAIHSMDGLGLFIRGNVVTQCGNAGIRIWRSENGQDGTTITGNRISSIDWKGGGNGQNGNGVNVFKADGVIVSDNHIADCAFTAVRVNSSNDTQVRGNVCVNSGEVAIFSEFAFSGSVIVDGAATGISITNFDSGGHIATCTGNIVRNITPKSAVNPDTRPVGIYAEAETVVSNNVVEGVPGVGIGVGFGPFLRNVVVSDNVVSAVDTGIAVSVVQESPAGSVKVAGNLIDARGHAIVGMEWEKLVSDDLARDSGRYPNVVVDGNTRSGAR